MNVISAYMLINSGDATTGGPYTVRFYDDNGDLIQTDANVPQYGTAHCTLLDGTIVDGLYFKGWNPAPTNVMRNLDCYPVRGDYIISHEEIHDSWETICADNGAHYPLGSYKSLIISVSYKDYMDRFNAEDGIPATGSTRYVLYNDHIMARYNNDPRYPLYPMFRPGNLGHDTDAFITVQCHMVKVAEGEDGSTSTWLSTGLARFGTDASSQGFYLFIDKNYDMNKAQSGYPSRYVALTPNYITDYSDNTLSFMADTILYRVLPEILRTKIKQVDKTYKGVASNIPDYSKTPLDKTKMCKVWVPSRKELTTYEASSHITRKQNVTYDPEYTGIDYSSVYVPNWETQLPLGRSFYLRSMCSYVGMYNYNKLTTVYRYAADDVIMENYYSSDMPNDYCLYMPFGFCL